MKKITLLLCVLVLLLNMTACGGTQTAETEPAQTPAAIQEATEAPREMVFYDSYYSAFPHLPVPESFVDVSIGGAGYADIELAFEYFPAEEDADVEELIKDYCLSLMDLGFSPRQGKEEATYLYSGDLLVAVIEPQEYSFYVFCVVHKEQNVEYDAMEISLNQTATSAFADVTPQAVAAGKQVKASDELFETTVTSRNDGECLIWIEAALHNKMDTRVEFQYNYYVTFLQDGFEPKEAKLVAAPSLPPNSEKVLTWYAEVPKTYLENCQSLTVRIGFVDQFQNINQKQLAEESALLCDVVLTEDQLASLKRMMAE